MEWIGFTSVVKRWWRVIMIAALVAGGIGYAVASKRTPTYEAETTMLVGPINTDFDTLRASGQLAQTYADLATSKTIRLAAARQLHIRLRPSDISATSNDVTRLLTIRAQNSDPKTAAEVANTLAFDLGRLIGTSKEGELRVIDRANPPPHVAGPRAALLAILAALVALLLTLGLVLIVEYVSDVIRSDEQLEGISDAPFLGSLSAPKRAMDQSGLGWGYRLIAAKIMAANGAGPTNRILLSEQGADAAAQAAANLAVGLAEIGPRVILIDAGDEGKITQLFGLEEHPGLSDLVREAREVVPQNLRSFLHSHNQGLMILPSGGQPVAAPTPQITGAIVDELVSGADAVLVYTGSIIRSPHALAWALAVDAALVLVQRGNSKRSDVQDAIEGLRAGGVVVAGTVLVDTRRKVTSRVGAAAAV